jgi:hypothetical protein
MQTSDDGDFVTSAVEKGGGHLELPPNGFARNTTPLVLPQMIEPGHQLVLCAPVRNPRTTNEFEAPIMELTFVTA